MWTVTRAVLDGTAAVFHGTGRLVMSTALPYLPANTGLPYIAPGHPAPGKFVQAQMCIANQGNNETGHFTEFLDIGGDGWGNHP